MTTKALLSHLKQYAEKLRPNLIPGPKDVQEVITPWRETFNLQSLPTKAVMFVIDWTVISVNVLSYSTPRERFKHLC